MASHCVRVKWIFNVIIKCHGLNPKLFLFCHQSEDFFDDSDQKSVIEKYIKQSNVWYSPAFNKICNENIQKSVLPFFFFLSLRFLLLGSTDMMMWCYTSNFLGRLVSFTPSRRSTASKLNFERHVDSAYLVTDTEVELASKLPTHPG